MCLQVSGASQANGSAVLQAPCGTGPSGYHQQLSFEFADFHDGKYYYRHRFRHSDKCAQVVNASQSNGANLIQFTCGSGISGYHQHWTSSGEQAEGVWHRHRVRHSGKCMNVPSLTSGEVVEQTTCGSGITGYSQQWEIMRVDGT